MKKWFAIFCIFLSNQVVAQEIPFVIWDQVESFLEDQDDDVDLTLILDRLQILYQHPIDLNQVGYDDLQELRLLSEIQINEILQHREAYGDFLQVEELQSIPSFGTDDINRLKSFVKVTDKDKIPVSLGQMFRNSRNEVFLKWAQTLEDKAGFLADPGEDPRYLGDKNQWVIRHRGNYEYKLRYGFIAEKDEGEQLWSDTLNSGLDYLTAFVYLKDYSTLLKDVALGDYSLSFGQGLISHNGFGAGKSAWVMDVKRGGRVIRPYSSVNENGYYRGAAATLRPRRDLEVTLFASRVNRDGNVRIEVEDPEIPDLFFSSLQTSGKHRTLNEKEDKSVVGLTSYGTSIKYIQPSYYIAVNHLSNNLSEPLLRSDEAFNRFRFSGDKLSNTSIDYSWRIRNIHLFGESAYASTGGLAHIIGAMIGLDRRMSMSLLFRDYDIAYNAIAPNAFGESSLVNNERGFYVGFDFALSHKWKLRTYADVWRHPWLRSSVNNPSTGKEYLVRLDYYLKRKLSVYAQYFFEEKLVDASQGDNFADKLTVGTLQTRHKLRVHFSNTVSKTLELRSRMEYTLFQNINGPSKGYMLYQDVIYKPKNFPVSFTSRFALFDTDDFNSRLFSYENNILYEFGIPTYSGRGFRYYFNFRYRITPRLLAEFRWARTYRNRGNNGSGLEEIDGNTRTDLKAQLKFSF